MNESKATFDCPGCLKRIEVIDLYSMHDHLFKCPENIIQLKLVNSKWNRFCNWFWSVDWNYLLAIAGGIFINSIVMGKIRGDWSLLTCVLEGLSFGFLLMELLKK